MKTKISEKLSYRDLIIFLIPFIIFLGYLYIYNPGIVRFDSFYQLHQIASSQMNNWHPFFHTFIEMLCLEIYPDTKGIAFLQIVTFSLMWMVICNYFRNDENGIWREFIIQVLFTLGICLIPINAIFSITLLKDVLFSYFLLFTCFLVKVLLDKKGNVSPFYVVIFSLSMSFVAQLRPNGILIILIFLVVLSAYLLYKYKNRTLPLSITLLTVLFILLILTLNVIYDVEDNEKDAISSKIMHMLVDYKLNLTIEDEDKAMIDQIITNDTKSLQEYDITFLDPITLLTNQTAYENYKAAVIEISIKYTIANPIHFLKYAFNSAPMVWNIIKDENNWHVSSYGTSNDYSWKRFYVLHDSKLYKLDNSTKPLKNYENASAKNSKTKMYKELDSIAIGFTKNKMEDTLFNSPAFYMYLSFVVIGAIYLLTRSKDIFLVYLPNLLNIIIIFGSTPAQDYRYLYPNLLLFYLLIIILISILTKPKPHKCSS